MPSSYSTNLKIELQATGENSGTWGTITNTNLGTALEQAIVGYGNPSYASDANLTLTYTDTNAAQAARALVLNVTSAVSLTGTRELVVPTIQKQYIVQNNTTGSQSITVKTSAGTGITVPNGRKAHLYVNGTDVIFMDDFVDINGGSIDGTTIGANSAAAGNFTTVDTTNIEVTNLKAKDGTAAGSIADSTGVVTLGSSVLTTTDINGGTIDGTTIGGSSAAAGTFTTLTTSSTVTLNGGTANGVLYLNGSKVATSGSALTFSSSTFTANNTISANNGTNILNVDSPNQQVASFVSGVGYGTLNLNASPLVFQIAAVEGMRLTSTGLGIGTSSPSEKLEVVGNYIKVTGTTNQVALRASNTGGDIYFGLENSAGNNFNTGTAYAGVIWRSGANPICFVNNSSEKMRLDSSGNLGLGVTPSAWTYFKPLQAVRSGFLGSAGQTGVSYNAYYDGAWKYIANDYALWYSQNATSGQHIWNIAASGTAGNAITFTQAMTLDSNGNLGVGSTAPTNSGGYKTLSLSGSTGGQITFQQSNADKAFIYHDATNFNIYNSVNGPLVFWTNSAERARITAAGYSKFSNAGTYVNSTGTYHEFNSDDGDDAVLFVRASEGAYSGNVLIPYATRNTTNNSFYYISCYNSGSATDRFRVADSGNVTNTNGSYGTISDVKMKTDIVDAGSQWDDIKAVRFRKFKMKDDPDQIVQLGVVAQELEQTSPGLVDEHQDYEEFEVTDNDGNATKKRRPTGTTTKSVKTSVLLMKAAVALQEAMARIESLEAKVAALETK